MKFYSDLIGHKVTPSDFRDIVSTWGLSHSSAKVREAESVALQHHPKVAEQHYRQNKQVQPTKFVQTYVREENIFPSHVKDMLNTAKQEVDDKIRVKGEERTKFRFKTLIEAEQQMKMKKKNKCPLGRYHRIRAATRNKFAKFLGLDEEASMEVDFVKGMKKDQFRKYVVRKICQSDEDGQEMRSLWKDMYEGKITS